MRKQRGRGKKGGVSSALRSNEHFAKREFVLAERNRLDTILKQMSEGVVVINNNNEIELINRRAVEMLGFDPGQELPESYKKFFILQLWKELHDSTSEIVKKELELHRPREAILVITLARLKGTPGGAGFVVAMRDITIEKRVEQMKSDFVANVAHEIRSPMAPMKDALSLVMDETVGPLNEKQKQFLGVVDSNIDRLARLIGELLDLSKIEAGKAEIRRELVDVAELLRNTLGSLTIHAKKKDKKLSFEEKGELPRMSLDRDRITQVIINLVMNALKFTPAGGEVVVSARSVHGGQDNREIKSVEVSISDSGPGLSRTEADMLFNRFKQLSNAGRAQGTGLGLAISKEIIRMHGGDIWVDSEPGKGSTFRFTLPV